MTKAQWDKVSEKVEAQKKKALAEIGGYHYNPGSERDDMTEIPEIWSWRASDHFEAMLGLPLPPAANRWEAWKARHFPRWLLRVFPVRAKVIKTDWTGTIHVPRIGKM